MRLMIALVALIATGCEAMEKPGVIECEAHIQANLRSPSTYKRVSAESYGASSGDSTLLVVIEYDAANAYGTPIRATQNCSYPVKNGKPDFEVDPEGTAREQAENMADQAEAAAMNAIANLQ